MGHMSVLEKLRNIPPDQIREELARVRAQRAQLAKDEALLEQVLALHGDSEQKLYVGAVTAWPESNEEVAPSPRPEPGTRRAQIQQIMAESDKPTWTPAEIIAALRERGTRARDEAIRVTLRRMLDRGQLERPGYGSYKLPSNDAPAQQAMDAGGSEE